MGTYEPRPIDTSKVKLSAELQELTEQLAENAHDNWARRRLSEGWTWGARRDDAAKKHPDLVPYGELSEAEKHYDRDTAMETLRAIIALGYRIERD
jgi:RyR domain